MTGGFKASRYGDKFSEIKAAAKRDARGEVKDPQITLKDPVRPLFEKREDAEEV